MVLDFYLRNFLHINISFAKIRKNLSAQWKCSLLSCHAATITNIYPKYENVKRDNQIKVFGGARKKSTPIYTPC